MNKKFTNKQQEILSVAKDKFYTNGFVETSVRELADELNLKAASLYSHFSSKEEILKAICDETHEDMRNIIAYFGTLEMNSEERFYEYVRVHLENIYQKEKENALYYKYWNLIDEKYNRRYSLNNYEYFSFVNRLVTDMFPEHVSLACYVPNATTLFILDILTSVSRSLKPEAVDLDMVVKDIQYRLVYGYRRGLKKTE